ncbi:MAG: phage tail tube protein [Phocaeicola sp.]
MGYVNGSDILMSINGKAAAHCTSHTTTYNTETKERAVKPASADPISAGRFKEKAVTGMSVQVKVDGLRTYGEEDSGYKALLAAWSKGETVSLKGFNRGSDATPYMSGNFIIASLEDGTPAGDDATYNVTFDNSGVVTIDETNVDVEPSND